jgi:hypothetical protein
MTTKYTITNRYGRVEETLSALPTISDIIKTDIDGRSGDYRVDLDDKFINGEIMQSYKGTVTTLKSFDYHTEYLLYVQDVGGTFEPEYAVEQILGSYTMDAVVTVSEHTDDHGFKIWDGYTSGYIIGIKDVGPTGGTLGPISPGINVGVAPASGTVTITDFTELNSTDTVNLIATDGTTHDFVNGAQSSVLGTWESTTSNDATATNLMNVINTSSGPAGTRFTATVDGAVVTITQAVNGSDGNTTITLTDTGTTGMSKTDFTGGTGSTNGIGRLYAEGDTAGISCDVYSIRQIILPNMFRTSCIDFEVAGLTAPDYTQIEYSSSGETLDLTSTSTNMENTYNLITTNHQIFGNTHGNYIHTVDVYDNDGNTASIDAVSGGTPDTSVSEFNTLYYNWLTADDVYEAERSAIFEIYRGNTAGTLLNSVHKLRTLFNTRNP